MTTNTTHRRLVRALLDDYGTTFAEESGITLRDEPAPLLQLLVMAKLMGARIGAAQAAEGTRGLLAAGFTTPEHLAASTWRQRVTVLNRNGYARYDESAARLLGQLVEQLEAEYAGDLRHLHDAAGSDVAELRRRLQAFAGVGPVAADIFLREVQGVWADVRPFADERTRRVAAKLDLPTTPGPLVELVDPADAPRLMAALIRVDLGRHVDEVRAAARD